MATLPNTNEWVDVYQLEPTDPVVGGAPNEATGAGMDNIPHLHLAKRTTWLKARVDALVAAVVDATTAVKGIVQLSTSTNSTSTTMAATPSAVKAVNDAVATKANQTTTVTVAGLATGGGDLSANRLITVPISTQAQAEAGTDNTTAMTPIRVAQRIAALIAGGTVQAGSAILTAITALAATGIIARTAAGVVAARTITAGTGVAVTSGDGVAGNPTIALDMTTAFGSALSTTGWQRLPSGLILQWGFVTGSATAGSTVTVTFPIAFPSYCAGIQMSPFTTNTSGAFVWCSTVSTTNFTTRASLASLGAHWYAIGA